VETALFVVLLVAFSFWLFGASILGKWIAYAVVLTLVLEAGGHAIERYMVMTLKRISRTVSFKSLQRDAEAVKKMFHREVVLYVSIPIGLITGTVTGLIGSWTTQATITFCIQLVLLLASFILIVFMVNAFARMSDPLFNESRVQVPTINEESLKKKTGILGSIAEMFGFLVPRPQTNKEDQEKQDLSLAAMITDLRKAYLYDSMHNVILVVVFAAITASLWNMVVNIKYVLTGLLGFSLIFGQLPYIIGQSLLHEKVLDRYEGVQRTDIAEKLKKNAPLFPIVDFLGALFATGTAGGLFYFLLDQFIKNALR
jgi:ABC-type multidrug transport system fused ATPase/permease subunit